jgi:hypothetical protein
MDSSLNREKGEIRAAGPGAGQPTIQAVVDSSYEEVKRHITIKDVKPSNIMIMLTRAMSVVDRVKGLSGPEKKEVVVHLVRRLLDEIPGDSEEKGLLRAAVELILPPLIDTLVAASRGKLDLNSDGAVTAGEVARVSAGCWKMCFPSGLWPFLPRGGAEKVTDV